MLESWWNEASKVQIFRCNVCNREIRGSPDLFTHLKGTRHREEMKNFKILDLRTTDSNQDGEEIFQTVSMTTMNETERCQICLAKVKKAKLEKHVKTCEEVETKGVVLKSEKKCQFCDQVFKTLQEAYYHVKTFHFKIKEEKAPMEKEPENIDYNIGTNHLLL